MFIKLIQNDYPSEKNMQRKITMTSSFYYQSIATYTLRLNIPHPCIPCQQWYPYLTPLIYAYGCIQQQHGSFGI